MDDLDLNPPTETVAGRVIQPQTREKVDTAWRAVEAQARTRVARPVGDPHRLHHRVLVGVSGQFSWLVVDEAGEPIRPEVYGTCSLTSRRRPGCPGFGCTTPGTPR